MKSAETHKNDLLKDLRIYSLLLVSIIVYQTVSSQQNDILVHDPVMIKQDSLYYLFCTGTGIKVLSSPDMNNWKEEDPVFNQAPSWTLKIISTFNNHIWAPDITFHNGTYYLYYSVSSFGKNNSCIGLAINKTLNPNDSDYKWKDIGKIVQSVSGRDLWNAIDPNLAFDNIGTPWLTFGSFWSGIKIVKLNNDLTSIAQPEEWYTIAKRSRDYDTDDAEPGEGAIEAPFIFKKNDTFYLFVSYDYCCRGVNSNYKIMIGRSEKITGPYVDKRNIKMVNGGASTLIEGDKDWAGVGHNSVYTFSNTDYIVCHGYDVSDNGKPKLIIKELTWSDAGWPIINENNK